MSAVGPQFKAHIADLLDPLGAIVFKRLFGGEGLSLDGVTFAFIMDETLYLRVDDATRPAFEEAGMEPFSYSTKKRRVDVRSFFTAPEGLYDDGDEFLEWARDALSAARHAAAEKAARKSGATGKGKR